MELTLGFILICHPSGNTSLAPALNPCWHSEEEEKIAELQLLRPTGKYFIQTQLLLPGSLLKNIFLIVRLWGCERGLCLFVFLETFLFSWSSSSSTFQAAELAAVTSCNPEENCLCLWPGLTCWQWYVPGQGQPFHTAQHGRAATPSHF